MRQQSKVRSVLEFKDQPKGSVRRNVNVIRIFPCGLYIVGGHFKRGLQKTKGDN
jgi:hypothetical protein